MLADKPWQHLLLLGGEPCWLQLPSQQQRAPQLWGGHLGPPLRQGQGPCPSASPCSLPASTCPQCSWAYMHWTLLSVGVTCDNDSRFRRQTIHDESPQAGEVKLGLYKLHQAYLRDSNFSGVAPLQACRALTMLENRVVCRQHLCKKIWFQ